MSEDRHMSEDRQMNPEPASATSPRNSRARRPAQSCDPCRRRKVRCDLGMPCSACRQSRGRENCAYSASARHYSTPRSNLDPALTTAHEQSAGSQETLRAPLSSDRAATTSISATIQERLLNTERRVQSIEESLSPKNGLDRNLPGASKTPVVPRNTCSASSGLKGLAIEPTVPLVRNTADKVKLFGSSHWLHTAAKFNVSDFDATELELNFVDTKAELVGMVRECRNLRQKIKRDQEPLLADPVPDFMSTYPTRETCDQLVKHYLRTFELIYRVVHIPTFWREYEQFWVDTQSVPLSFRIQLGLVMSIGSVFYADRDPPMDLMSRKWIYAAQWWLVGPTAKSTMTLAGIQNFCLLLISRQVTSFGPSLWLSEGSLLKMAMVLGLHRDTALFNLNPLQSALRERLWTTVLELVVHGSLDSSTPLLLTLTDFDAHIPLNISDADLLSAADVTVLQHPLQTFTETSIQILLRKFLHVRVEAAKAINNARVEISYEIAIELATKIQDLCGELATYCRLHWVNSLSMHHKFLDMQLRRYVLLLHRPFMLHASKEPRFYLSRKICLESAMIIASYASPMSLPAGVLDDLSRLMIMSTGSFRGALTLDVITVLGLEVIRQIEDSKHGSSFALCTDGNLILDPLAEMARAQREPVMRALEHLKEQLLQIIRLGHPHLKRYIFLAGVISQIRAMETGQSVQPAVVQAAQESLRICYTALQSASTPIAYQDQLNLFDVNDLALNDPAFLMDLEAMNSQSSLDLSTFMFVSF